MKSPWSNRFIHAGRRFYETWKSRAGQLKMEVYAIYLAYGDRRVPWYARLFAAAVVAYAFSPIDLIPDFIPVLGYLDDLILIPLGVKLALMMIPAEVMQESRKKAQQAFGDGKPLSRAGTVMIVAVWVLLAALALVWLIRASR